MTVITKNSKVTHRRVIFNIEVNDLIYNVAFTRIRDLNVWEVSVVVDLEQLICKDIVLYQPTLRSAFKWINLTAGI